MPELTVRAQDMNERMTQEVGNARWMRVIYRQIDLMKEKECSALLSRHTDERTDEPFLHHLQSDQ